MGCWALVCRSSSLPADVAMVAYGEQAFLKFTDAAKAVLTLSRAVGRCVGEATRTMSDRSGGDDGGEKTKRNAEAMVSWQQTMRDRQLPGTNEERKGVEDVLRRNGGGSH